jgi:uncharacterized protein YdhG (YjbR/CyaY superfamily)
MASADIDAYLADVPEPGRSTLEELRRRILAVVPDAEQCISYAMPGFRVHGKVIAGFAAFANHLSYFPHSGSVFNELEDDLRGYERTKSSLHFAFDTPLPKALVKKLIEVRLQQMGNPR